jgi:hypothetical protein
MAKKSKIDGEELSLIAKAIRRGEKLERTLSKLTRLNEPQAHVETFLKAVQKGLEKLRQEPIAESKAPKKKATTAQKPKLDDGATKPAATKRVRKPKTPDLVTTADTKTG